jgi:hypothetical protein
MWLATIPIILYCLSGVCDAVMDTCSDHFSISIFKKMNPNIWNKNISWVNKYINDNPANGFKKINFFGIEFNYPVQLTDAWHFFKMIKELLIIMAILVAVSINIDYSGLFIFGYFITLSSLRNVCFNLFYNKILLKK